MLSRCTTPRRSWLSLQTAFKDPSSPFHIPPGETGPASPDDPPESYRNKRTEPGLETEPTSGSHDAPGSREEAAKTARATLSSMGYDASSFWEQSIVWGHHDAFRQVHPSKVRFIESGRMQWVMNLGNLLGGKERVQAMLAGQGISVILKSVNINFRRPVTFPDTLLVGHKAIVSSSRTQFILSAVLYSYAQQKVVADSEGVIVWYDYDKLRKCDPGDEAWRVLRGVMGAEYREGIGRPSPSYE
ncbi:hypothetical protein ID866_4914 [Astraeus odoratus]|nr:hypothetical protein ID866_4914 [Astraeus odoratus]